MWAPHNVSGYYLSPYRTCAIGTQAFRVSDSLDWFSLAVKVPGSSVSELVLAARFDQCYSPAHGAPGAHD